MTLRFPNAPPPPDDAIENRYPGRCDGCGDPVPARAGVAVRDRDGSWFVRCLYCHNAERNRA